MSKAKNTHRRNYTQKHNGLARPVWVLLGGVAGLIALFALVYLAIRQDGPPRDYEPEVQGAPRLEVSEEIVDYGDVKLNTTIETVFNVRNVGDAPLVIQGEPVVELVEGC